jgi:hypothetical protein
VNQHFADLVGGIGILALIGVVVLEQELAVAVLDDRLRVGLNLRHHAQDLGDLEVERRLGAVDARRSRSASGTRVINAFVNQTASRPLNLWHALNIPSHGLQ